MGVKKCNYCGTTGVKHDGVFSCVNDLTLSVKKMKPKLRQAEDLLYWVMSSGALDLLEKNTAFTQIELDKIKQIKKITGLD